jgi:hypothetical protein
MIWLLLVFKLSIMIRLVINYMKGNLKYILNVILLLNKYIWKIDIDKKNYIKKFKFFYDYRSVYI